MIPTIEVRDSILHEIVGGCRSQLAIHIAINKKLIANIANQSKTSHTIISADASNFYGYIAHSLASLMH